MLPAARIRQLLKALSIAAFVLFVITVRVVTSAREELSVADACLARGDSDGAVVHYRRAARWYAPGSPYHVMALMRLARLGQEAQSRGDWEGALHAYRSLRAAIMATRSFYTPEPALLKATNFRIATLTAELPVPQMDYLKLKSTLRDEHLALLEAVPGPSVFWTCMLLGGFFCWVCAAFVFSVRAIDEHDRWVGREARIWGALIVLGFSLFVLGMTLA